MEKFVGKRKIEKTLTEEEIKSIALSNENVSKAHTARQYQEGDLC